MNELLRQVLDFLGSTGNTPNQSFGEAQRYVRGRSNVRNNPNMPTEVLNFASHNNTSPQNVMRQYASNPQTIREQSLRQMNPRDSDALMAILDQLIPAQPQQMAPPRKVIPIPPSQLDQVRGRRETIPSPENGDVRISSEQRAQIEDVFMRFLRNQNGVSTQQGNFPRE